MKNNEFEFVKKVVKGCIYFVVGLFVLSFILIVYLLIGGVWYRFFKWNR